VAVKIQSLFGFNLTGKTSLKAETGKPGSGLLFFAILPPSPTGRVGVRVYGRVDLD
jgi:hypothetical protein